MQGFILTRHWRDTKNGIVLDLWLATAEGPVKLAIPHQQAVCFVRASDQSQIQKLLAPFPFSSLKPLDLKNFYGEPVMGLYCQQQRQLWEVCDTLAKAGIDCWENDIRPHERFLMERFVTSSLRFSPQSAYKRSKAGDKHQQFTTKNIQPTDYHPELRVVSLDIETSMDSQELYSIAIYADQYAKIFMVSDDESAVVENTSLNIQWCRTARECLQFFLDWLHDYDPDILIGWHVIQFDCWVLAYLCKRWQVPFTLGRDKQLPHWRTEGEASTTLVAEESTFDGKRRYLQVPGRVVLDGIELLRTAFYNFESFSLQAVANTLLGESKLLQHDDRAEAISELFYNDKIALAEYNLQDCKLVWDIFQQTELLEFAIERTRLTGLAIDKMGGSVASFDYAYLPTLHRQGYVAPNLGELESTVVSPGGYVMDSKPGLYQHVLVLDFKSLYPSIIRTFTIDPYAFWVSQHQSLSEAERVEGFNGASFSREHFILPDVISDLWQERDKAKRDNNQPLSQAIKIIMNSFYGVLGSTGCRFFDPRVCSSITLRGHEIIQRSQEWIESQGYQVIYGDTDSLFVWLGDDFTAENDHINAAAQKVGNTLALGLNQWWQDSLKTQHNISSALEIEFETHYQRFLMPTIRGSELGSKKRYAGTVLKDGEINLVFKGLETVRADWTPLAKRFQQQLYKMIFADEPYQEYIRQVVTEVLSGQCDHELIYQKRLRRPLVGYQKSNPPHIKAARKQEAATQQLMHKGDQVVYVITLNGPEPIEYQQSLVDYQHYIDKQLKPIADSILCFLDDSFDVVVARQFRLL